jgi:predicted small lipoprotein YifL
VVRNGLGIALALVLAGGLAGCGKKGPPGPPEGEEASYNYPKTYPNPATVVPEQPEELRKSREAPAHAGGITVFPTDSRTKTTYGSGSVQ